MARKTNTKILKKHLIFCEGRDEQEFLIPYLNSSALSDVPAFSNDVQVIDFGGNSELFQKLEVLKNTANFENVESLLIVRDAETNADGAVKEIKKALEKAGLPIPQGPHIWEGENPRVGFLIFPTCSDTAREGTLEDLCLSILSENQSDDVLVEIDSFLAQLGSKFQRNFSHIFKTKLHTYFSVHNDYVSFKIGEAAAAGAFNWYHERMQPFRDFLQEVL